MHGTRQHKQPALTSERADLVEHLPHFGHHVAPALLQQGRWRGLGREGGSGKLVCTQCMPCVAGPPFCGHTAGAGRPSMAAAVRQADWAAAHRPHQPPHLHVRPARRTQRGVQHRAPLGGVDALPRKHGFDLALQPCGLAQVKEQLRDGRSAATSVCRAVWHTHQQEGRWAWRKRRAVLSLPSVVCRMHAAALVHACVKCRHCAHAAPADDITERSTQPPAPQQLALSVSGVAFCRQKSR